LCDEDAVTIGEGSRWGVVVFVFLIFLDLEWWYVQTVVVERFENGEFVYVRFWQVMQASKVLFRIRYL
jgi:hypothetical protein